MLRRRRHRLVVAATGAKSAIFNYDPFGNTVVAEGETLADLKFRFGTKYMDEIGLYYYGLRSYSPELGRWVNRDPVGQNGGSNLYVAMGNQIPRKVDALGLWSLTWNIGPGPKFGPDGGEVGGLTIPSFAHPPNIKPCPPGQYGYLTVPGQGAFDRSSATVEMSTTYFLGVEVIVPHEQTHVDHFKEFLNKVDDIFWEYSGCTCCSALAVYRAKVRNLKIQQADYLWKYQDFKYDCDMYGGGDPLSFPCLNASLCKSLYWFFWLNHSFPVLEDDCGEEEL